MRTEDFIHALAADRTVEPAPGRMFALALAIGAVIAVTVFELALGVRSDAGTALHTLRYPFKFVVTVALAIAGVNLAVALVRPGADVRTAARRFVVPALLIGGAVVVELIVVPASGWRARLVGNNAAICLTAIPVIAIGPLVALLYAMRHAAPTAPGRAGAGAGLLAAALAATFYASHCTDDSPLFVAFWYTIAIAIVIAAGALLGSRILRW